MTGFLDLPPEIRNRIYFYTESLIAAVAWAHVPRDGCLTDWKVGGGNYVAYGEWYFEYCSGESRQNFLALSRFFVQASLAKVCRQLRKEALPIFYGANTFQFEDEYYPEHHGVHTPFVKVLLDLFTNIKAHLPLFTNIEINCAGLCAQDENEIISALTDLGFEFKAGVLSNKYYVMRMEQYAGLGE